MRGITLVLVSLLAACAGEPPKINESRAGLNLEVSLVDAGAEPRAELRYQGAAGRSERLLLRLSLASFIETRRAAAAVEAPMLDLVLRVGDTYQAKEPGVWGYPLSFEVIGVHDGDTLTEEDQKEVASVLSSIAEAKGAFEIDDRGITRAANVTIPPSASPRLLTLLGNIRTTLLASALPKEAVGIGARWQTERLIKVSGVAVPQTVTYTLLGREGDVLRLGIAVRQSATPGQFPLGTDGTKFNLEAYEVSATGTALVDLYKFVPLIDLHGQSQLRATVTRGDQVEPLALEGDVLVTIMPLPAAQPAAADVASPAAPAAQPVAASAPATQTH